MVPLKHSAATVQDLLWTMTINFNTSVKTQGYNSLQVVFHFHMKSSAFHAFHVLFIWKVVLFSAFHVLFTFQVFFVCIPLFRCFLCAFHFSCAFYVFFMFLSREKCRFSWKVWKAKKLGLASSLSIGLSIYERPNMLSCHVSEWVLWGYVIFTCSKLT